MANSVIGAAKAVIPIFTVDSFTDRAFGGNQAGVCLLLAGERPTDAWMQGVAAEMGFSETAFLRPGTGAFDLRWFSPTKEVPLCGHATLAAAHVLWQEGVVPYGQTVAFDTLSGRLTCNAAQDGATMDFPTDAPVPRDAPPGLFTALGCRSGSVFEGKALGNLMVVLDSEAEVVGLAPDRAGLRRLSDEWAYIVTAPAADGDGYVCRYFAPAWGIDEDAATGSIQCTLGPYWAERLARSEVLCRQRSRRGARMRVRPDGARTHITGTAVTTVRGHIVVPL